MLTAIDQHYRLFPCDKTRSEDVPFGCRLLMPRSVQGLHQTKHIRMRAERKNAATQEASSSRAIPATTKTVFIKELEGHGWLHNQALQWYRATRQRLWQNPH